MDIKKKKKKKFDKCYLFASQMSETKTGLVISWSFYDVLNCDITHLLASINLQWTLRCCSVGVNIVTCILHFKLGNICGIQSIIKYTAG